MSNTN
jgi:hypothetical protein